MRRIEPWFVHQTKIKNIRGHSLCKQRWYFQLDELITMILLSQMSGLPSQKKWFITQYYRDIKKLINKIILIRNFEENWPCHESSMIKSVFRVLWVYLKFYWGWGECSENSGNKGFTSTLFVIYLPENTNYTINVLCPSIAKVISFIISPWGIKKVIQR